MLAAINIDNKNENENENLNLFLKNITCYVTSILG